MSDLYMSNITGLLDVDSIVQGLLQVKTKDIQNLQNKKASLQAQVSSLNNLFGTLKEIQNFIETLNISNLFNKKSVIVDNPEILSATASQNTPNITIRDIKVLQLSQEEIKISSSGITDLNSTLSPADFTLKYFLSDNNYEEFQINFSGGTLQDLVNLINSSQNRVSASILFDGTYYKLILSEKDASFSTKETDTTSVIEIINELPYELGNLETFQNAQNAKIQIGTSNSIFISSSNTFKNILSGLTITVYKTGTTNITVKNDYSEVTNNLNNLLTKINTLIDLINSMTAKGGLFQGTSMITQIKTQIFSLMKPFVNLGVLNIDDNGKYSLNMDTLNNLYQNDLEGLNTAFSQIKNTLLSSLEIFITTLNSYKSIQDKQIEAINEKINKIQENLKKEEQKLRLEFSKIEALMYQNEQLRLRLEDFVKTLSQMTKSD